MKSFVSVQNHGKVLALDEIRQGWTSCLPARSVLSRNNHQESLLRPLCISAIVVLCATMRSFTFEDNGGPRKEYETALNCLICIMRYVRGCSKGPKEGV